MEHELVRDTPVDRRHIFPRPDAFGGIVRGHYPRVGADSCRATFDTRSRDVPSVGPSEEVRERDLAFAEVVEEDDFFAEIAVPPDGAFACLEWLIWIAAVAKGRARLTRTGLALEPEDAPWPAPFCSSRS